MTGQTGYVDDTPAVHPLTGGSVDTAVGDADAKRILKYRIVLANILKATPHKDCAASASTDFSSDCTMRTTQG